VSFMVCGFDAFPTFAGGRRPEYISGRIIFKQMIGGN
jgi:hypothetical protein